jgi:hypothetical protein
MENEVPVHDRHPPRVWAGPTFLRDLDPGMWVNLDRRTTPIADLHNHASRVRSEFELLTNEV